MALNPRLPEWRDSVVWIIGASSGIGAATAHQLLGAGARVALSARTAEALAREAGSEPRAYALPLDYTDSAAVARAWDSIVERWKRIDLVLIVAGTHRPMRAWDIDEAAALDLLKTNLHGVIASCAAIVPRLIDQKRSAIGIVASVAGYRGLPKALVYGASKAAVINFTESLYLDLAPKDIGVYLINPGFVATPLTAKNDFTMPALISADEAAKAMLAGLRRGGFEIHFPKRFTRVMKLLRLLPYSLYFAAVNRITRS